jgi:hypothetical protein
MGEYKAKMKPRDGPDDRGRDRARANEIVVIIRLSPATPKRATFPPRQHSRHREGIRDARRADEISISIRPRPLSSVADWYRC